MGYPYGRITLTEVLNVTARMKHAYENSYALVTDARREDRLTKQECRPCFYLYSKAGGCVITHSPCGQCEKEMVFATNCTDRLCIECAKSMRLCKHCGADIELKQRRKL